jgi:hypothetical protein
MTTLEPPNLRRFAGAWELAIDTAEARNDAATFSGIVGDLAHRASGGYHISREDQVDPNNYSVADCPEDKEGRSDYASAVDMNMLSKDMTLVYGRLYRSWQDRSDPRLDVCRGINGTLDGTNAIRIDCQFMTQEWATSDHLWHIHLEILRKFSDDAGALAGVLSVIVGETLESWLARTSPAPVRRNLGEEEEMPQLLRDGFGIDESGKRIKGAPFTPIGYDNVGGGLADNGPAWLILATDPWGEDAVAKVRLCSGNGAGWGTIQTLTFGKTEGWVKSIPLPTGGFVSSLARQKQSADDTSDDYPVSFTVHYGQPV